MSTVNSGAFPVYEHEFAIGDDFGARALTGVW